MTAQLKPIPEETLEPLPVDSEAPVEEVKPIEKTEPAVPAQPEPAVEEQQAAVPKQKPKRGRPPGSRTKDPGNDQ